MNGVGFLYGTWFGRGVLRLILKTHADRLAVRFLRSSMSHAMIGRYIKRNNIDMSEFAGKDFRTFRDFFARERTANNIDITPEHLISPCDGWLSAYPIGQDSSFYIKGSYYRLTDLLQDNDLCSSFQDGTCLIFRLGVSDYHHYCYVDDGYQCENRFINGELHSIQPIACEHYPVYTLNRRMWTLLLTEHFGPVVQTEIGALIVGGIYNEAGLSRFCKGMEMGHFELAGSTIVLLFQKDFIQLLPTITEHLSTEAELKVSQGMWIGNSIKNKTKEI